MIWQKVKEWLVSQGNYGKIAWFIVSIFLAKQGIEVAQEMMNPVAPPAVIQQLDE